MAPRFAPEGADGDPVIAGQLVEIDELRRRALRLRHRLAREGASVRRSERLAALERELASKLEAVRGVLRGHPRCGARARDGARCQALPVCGREGVISGRCRLHGGLRLPRTHEVAR